MKQKVAARPIPIEVQFENSVELVRSLPAEGPLQLSYSTAAKVYSYFKQSKFGPCRDPKPSFWDVVKKTKWEAWTKLGEMPRHTAMKHYVCEIKMHFQEFLKTADFQGKHCDFGDVVVRFCDAVDLPCPRQLESLRARERSDVKGREIAASAREDGCDVITQMKVNANGQRPPQRNTNGLVIRFENEAGLNGKDTEGQDGDDEGDSGHADEDCTTASLNGNGVASHSEAAESSADESGEEIYCDSMDPDEVSKLGHNRRPSSGVDGDGHFDSSDPTPVRCNGLSTSPVAGGQAAPVPVQASTPGIPQKALVPSHGAHDESNACPSVAAKDIPARRHGVDRHHRSPGHRSTHQQRRDKTPTRGPSEDVECDSDAMADALRNFDSSGSGREPSDTGSDASLVSAAANDRMLHALRRLHRDMHVISERIAAIEHSLCCRSQGGGSWWEINAPPTKTVLFFLLWPVLVNVAFLVWRRRRRNQR